MNIILVFCLSLFIATTLGAQIPKFCVVNGTTQCETAKTKGLNVTCHVITNGSCVDEVASGEADLGVASADDMVKNVDKVKIVLAENYGVKDNPFVRYIAVAVVKKDANFEFKDLKGKKSCHTGTDRTAGWKIPVGYLLRTKQMPFVENQYKSVAEFFNGSCAPGIENKSTADNEVKTKLCSQCYKNCSSDDRYADYSGAFRCMAEGRGDVAFVKHTTPEDTIGQNVSGYQLLCRDGGNKEVKNYTICFIDKRPSGAIVTGNAKDASTIKMYRKIIQGVDLDVLKNNSMVSSGVKKLGETNSTTREYVGDYYSDVMALTQNTTGPSAQITSTTGPLAQNTSTTGPPAQNTSTTGPPAQNTSTTGTTPSGSSSTAVSFVIQVLGVLSLFFMF